MFLDDKVLDSLHDEVGALGHQFGEHVDGFGPSASILAGPSGNLRA